MAYRLMVVGSDASTVFDRVFADMQTQLVGDLAAASATAVQASDVVPAVRVLKDPQGALHEATTSLRSDDGGPLLVKGLDGMPSPSFDTLGWNLQLAADADLSVVYALDAAGLGDDLVQADIDAFTNRAAANSANVAGVVLVGARGRTVTASVPVLTSPVSAEGLEQLGGAAANATTPLGFKVDLLSRAAADKKRIVLPEGTEPRILKATAELLQQEVADIILIGDPDEVTAAAAAAGVSVEGARIVPTTDPTLVPKYVAELVRIRANKGMTEEQAQKLVATPTYFATLMVQTGDADGMVSGATHTTAETIRPAFQIIKAAPGTSLVSSAFLMLLPDHVLVLADCAVVISPTADELAQIAVSSAETARQFGLDPRVALLSYSTGSSGMGPTVDLVSAATKQVREKAPGLAVEGPIQYDAAVDPTVGKQKAPDSDVAGRANVLVFPSLDAGNIAYKAIQRSSGAVAVGPILQGLNKPVNDLSRGALVEDIVNTVAITAIQAGGRA